MQDQNTLNKVLSLLSIRPGEGQLVLLLIGQGFFLGIASLLGRTVAYSLFLVEFDADSLPYAYIGISIFATGITFLYLRLGERFSLAKLLTVNFAFIVLMYLGLRAGLGLSVGRWVIFSLPVVFGVINTLTIIAFWGQSGRLFDLQQGKRLFGLLGTGSEIATLLGGFVLVPLSVGWVGTPNLLVMASFFMAVVLGFQIYQNRLYADRLNVPPEGSGQGKDKRHVSSASQLERNYVLLIFATFALFILGIYFVDNIFYSQVEGRYESADAISSFLGRFFGLTSIVVLLIQSVVAARLLKRYGLGVVMLLTPVALLIFSGLMAITGTIWGMAPLFFWLAVGANFTRWVLDTVDNAAVNMLYQPLPAQQRTRAQTVVDGIIYPVAIGAAGVALLFLRNVLGLDVLQLTYVVLFILAIWISLVVLLSREYPKLVVQALAKRAFGDASLLITDNATTGILRRELTSPHVGVVMSALDMLEASAPETLPIELPNLLGHPVAEIRLDVLRRVERLNLTSVLPAINKRIRNEGSAIVQGASLRVLASMGEPDLVDEVYSFLDHHNRQVRQGAMIGLLRSGEIEGIVATGGMLNKLIASDAPADRIYAAQVLGESDIRSFYRPLLKLLGDDRPEVRQAALKAAGRLQNPKVWPAVVDGLGSPRTRAAAVTALVAAGDAVLPELRSAFAQQGQHQGVLLRLAQICGQIRGPNAVSLLLDNLDRSDAQVRTQILFALGQCDYQAGDEELPGVLAQIKAEIAHASWILAALVDLRADDHPGRTTGLTTTKGSSEATATSLLTTALTHNLAQLQARLFLWLSFIYDPQAILRARDTLRPSVTANGHISSEKRAYALEIIDLLVATELKVMLLPLLEELTLPARLQRLSDLFPQQKLDHQQRLGEIITGPEMWVNPWTKACALYAADRSAAVDLTETIASVLSASDLLVREMAVWTLARLDSEMSSEALAELSMDPNPQVSRAIAHIQSRQLGDKVMLSTVEKVMRLKAISFFAETPEEILAEVAAALEDVELSAGQAIEGEDDADSSMYIILEGQVRVQIGDHLLSELGENDYFGELSVLDPVPRSTSITALKDTRLLRLDQEPFRELLDDQREVSWQVMQFLARQLRRAQAQVKPGGRPRGDVLGEIDELLSES